MLGWWMALGLSVVSAAEPLVEVPDALRVPAIPLTPVTLGSLAGGDWGKAVAGVRLVAREGLSAGQVADLAFVEAWALVRDGRAREAEPLLAAMAGPGTAPLPWLALTRGEVLHAVGRELEAIDALAAVPIDAPTVARAGVVRAEILRELGRTADATAVLEALVARPDPAPGNEVALLLLARFKGPGTPDANALLRRLWTHYPASAEASAAEELLARHDPSHPATDAERIWRARRAMDAGMSATTLKALEGVASVPPASDPLGCLYAYTLGRTHYKKNALSQAIAAFGDAGRRCGPTDDDLGAKILYLDGQARFRKGDNAGSAAAYGAIPELYPSSTMADDGLTRAGIALLEAGDVAGAQAAWERALADFPGGDTVPEATMRLAWSHYLAGRPGAAVDTAERLGALDPGVDAWSVLGGRYWAARWMLFPDVTHPAEAEESGRADALAGWEHLLRTEPASFYAQLAYSRLKEEAPTRAAAFDVRQPLAGSFGPWRVRSSFFADPNVGWGVALARLGLVNEADRVWSALDLVSLPAEELAWIEELRTRQGAWLTAHKWLQQAFRIRSVGSFGERAPAVVAVAWPDRYWSEVQTVAEAYAYPARMFHALVREESSFDKDIKSFAGARGLSQVMPATAQEVARWLGRSVSTSELNDPVTNLTLGSRYLQSCYQTQKQNPYLAMASYNAGPARISGWVSAWGNPPLDEFVERIPIRETRHYVLKVSTSWQVMNLAYDADQPPFPDLSAFNHHAWPIEGG